jgi:hypothetical protein
MMTALRDTRALIAFVEASGELRPLREFTPETTAAFHHATTSPGVSQPRLPSLTLPSPNTGTGLGSQESIQSP